MQIFVPYANPIKTAKCLDNRRLNKQILETIQILSANTGIDVGWKIPKYIYNHPNTLLWIKDSSYLVGYLAWLLVEYKKRRNKDHKGLDILYRFFSSYILPCMFNEYTINHLTPEFCKQHQQKLLEKDKKHYSRYFKRD